MDGRAQRLESDESSSRGVKGLTKDVPEQRPGSAGRTWPGVDGEGREEAEEGFMEERGRLRVSEGG